jgi:hypothetical protein
MHSGASRWLPAGLRPMAPDMSISVRDAHPFPLPLVRGWGQLPNSAVVSLVVTNSLLRNDGRCYRPPRPSLSVDPSVEFLDHRDITTRSTDEGCANVGSPAPVRDRNTTALDGR